ncbi:fibronectin type III domain-containing protein [Fredinandcohnia onubensis]|uniref:fibronectin type III domain-containing protein n=1 Tax=Fredinandcohnia onubensis TaxID=1571209 RepID=UPI000C0C0F06|nr:fibronectin type III domain-containing protein [Fredinandcohnia onubensis]
MKSFKVILSVFLTFLFVSSSFNVVAADSKKGASPNAPSSPVNLQIPNLAYDEESITLVWEKPEHYNDIVDFNIYMNKKKIGSALEDNSGPAKAYIDNFYENIDKDNFHEKILIHNFQVNNLKPNKSYEFRE